MFHLRGPPCPPSRGHSRMRTSFEGIVLLHVKAHLPGAVHASARRGLCQPVPGFCQETGLASASLSGPAHLVLELRGSCGIEEGKQTLPLLPPVTCPCAAVGPRPGEGVRGGAAPPDRPPPPQQGGPLPFPSASQYPELRVVCEGRRWCDSPSS